jgi:phage terminase small subunit
MGYRKALTPGQEKFAQLVVLYGERKYVAYRKAFPLTKASDQVCAVRASKMLRHPMVEARVEELREKAERALDVSVEKIGRQLARIAFMDLRDCFDDKGALLPMHELPEHVALALDGIDVVEMAGGMKIDTGTVDEENGEPVLASVPIYTKKVRFGRMKALELAANWRKMLVQKMEVGAPGEFTSMTDEQLAEEDAKLTKAVELIRESRKRKKVVVKTPKKAKG